MPDSRSIKLQVSHFLDLSRKPASFSGYVATTNEQLLSIISWRNVYCHEGLFRNKGAPYGRIDCTENLKVSRGSNSSLKTLKHKAYWKYYTNCGEFPVRVQRVDKLKKYCTKALFNPFETASLSVKNWSTWLDFGHRFVLTADKWRGQMASNSSNR